VCAIVHIGLALTAELQVAMIIALIVSVACCGLCAAEETCARLQLSCGRSAVCLECLIWQVTCRRHLG